LEILLEVKWRPHPFPTKKGHANASGRHGICGIVVLGILC
jgi:hypothetical protein